jgi:hypothetical protein
LQSPARHKLSPDDPNSLRVSWTLAASTLQKAGSHAKSNGLRGR